MDLKDYLDILRRSWMIIAGACVLGLLAAVGYCAVAQPVYAATAQVVVSMQPVADATTSDLVQGATYTRTQVRTYVRLIDEPLVLDPAARSLGIPEDADAMADRVEASNPTDTTLIAITAKDASPDAAADLANAVAAAFAAEVADLETPVGSRQSRVKVTTTSQAKAPSSPVEPNKTMTIALGLLLGAMAGAGAAILRATLSTRIRDERDLERVTSAPVLGVIPDTPETRRSPLVILGDPHGIRAEAYRRLRTNLQFVDLPTGRKSLAVVSSVANEGKTTTSINLASIVADAGLRACLVEADMRRPQVALRLGLEGGVGLTSVLVGRAHLADVLQPWGGQRHIHVLPCGQIPPNPTELIDSRQMRDLVSQLENSFDLVIFDVPPLLPVVDGAIMARVAGGALMVVASGKARRGDVAHALETLETVEASLLGMVLTMAGTSSGAYARAYSAAYAPNSSVASTDAMLREWRPAEARHSHEAGRLRDGARR